MQTGETFELEMNDMGKHQREQLKESIGTTLTAEWNRQAVKGPIPAPEDREAFFVMGVLLAVGYILGIATGVFLL